MNLEKKRKINKISNVCILYRFVGMSGGKEKKQKLAKVQGWEEAGKYKP